MCVCVYNTRLNSHVLQSWCVWVSGFLPLLQLVHLAGLQAHGRVPEDPTRELGLPGGSRGSSSYPAW